MNISKPEERNSEWSITFDSLTSDKNLSHSLSEWRGTEWDNVNITIKKPNERREKREKTNTD